MNTEKEKSERDDYEEWQSGTQYSKDSIVIFHEPAEFLWKSKWITSDKPGTSTNGAGSDSWEKLPHPLWDATISYYPGDTVRYNNKIWVAKWINLGAEPGKSQQGAYPWDEYK